MAHLPLTVAECKTLLSLQERWYWTSNVDIPARGVREDASNLIFISDPNIGLFDNGWFYDFVESE